MRRMLTAKLQNRSGVLNRFTGVLSRRQVNIESISVGATEDPNVSRITIIIDVASHDEVEQIIKQLNRQIDVIRIRDITDKPHLEREVILVKMSAPAEKRAEILAIIQPFRATVVDVAPSSITIQIIFSFFVTSVFALATASLLATRFRPISKALLTIPFFPSLMIPKRLAHRVSQTISILI